MGGFRFVVDLLSNQAEPIINLFEQVCATTTTTVTSSSKNDPRLANASSAQTSQPAAAVAAPTPVAAPVEPVNTNTNIVKEERESISNAVASLPPAQVSHFHETKSLFF